MRHKTRYHQSQGIQTSIQSHLKPKKPKEGKNQLKLWNCELVASANLSKQTLEGEPFKIWIGRLSKRYNVPEMATEVPMSRRTLSRGMEAITKETLDFLKSNVPNLVKSGQIAMQADHVTITKATGEKTNSFLAIIVTVRNSSFEMVPFPICFEPSFSKTFDDFRRDLKRILKVKNV